MGHALRALLVALAGVPALAGATPTSLFVFGDSLADAGNNAVVFDTKFGVPPGTLRTGTPIASPGFIPDFPYASNRYSNGPVWVEQLASGLGITNGATASLLGGTNFAFGGARTGPLDPTGTQFPASLLTQVGGFLAAAGPTVPSSALYVVQGGGNDARDIFAAALPIALTGGDPSALIASRSAQYGADIASIVLALENAGARKLLVANVPDIGATPAIQALAAGFGPFEEEVEGLATSIAMAMSAQLALALAGLPDFGSDLWTLDLFNLVQAIAADPVAFGLTDVTSACAFACADVATSLFWDGIHPTTAGHFLLAQQALLLIPEPGTVPLTLLAVFAVASLRRRRRS